MNAHGHDSVRDVGHLHEKSARELADYAHSDNPLEVSISVAAINLLIDVDENRCVQMNAAEVLAEAAAEILSQADIVAITGNALINGTLDGLLSACPPDIPVMVFGPSTPLSPILFEHSATILSGTRVVDKNASALTIGQAASFRQVEGIKLLTITNEKNK